MAATSGPRGGAYVAELTEVARLVSERVDGGSHPWRLVYQSRSGPPSQPWLEPDVRDYLAEIAAAGRAAAAVLVPAGFVSDHMEVRYDLDVEAADAAGRLGIAVARAATPGTHPRFVADGARPRGRAARTAIGGGRSRAQTARAGYSRPERGLLSRRVLRLYPPRRLRHAAARARVSTARADDRR